MLNAPLIPQKMSSRSDFQEFESHGPAEVREKVDIQLMGTMLSRHMENPANRNSHKETESLKSQSQCDLRKSLAWDSAFFTSPGILDPEEMLETINFQIMDNGWEIDMDKKRSSATSAEPEKVSGIGDCSMRKSLAWDNAFFTSAGILDAEELSIINRGFKKSQAHILPGIEDVRRSFELNSSINSDGYSLESLEIDLFGDVRASLCKSSKSSSKEGTSNSKLRRSINLRSRTSSRPDASSRIRAEDGQLKETATRSRESKVSLKPPKIILGSKNPPRTAAKEMASPVGTKYIQIENDDTKSAAANMKIVSKRTCLRDSGSVIHNSATATKTPPPVLPHDSHDFSGFCHVPLAFSGNTPPNPRRTTDSQLAASLPMSRTPWKNFAGNNHRLLNSVDSSLMFTRKSSVCMSPASSNDEWSSESSPKPLEQRFINSAAGKVTSCRQISFDSDASQTSDCLSYHCDRPCSGHEKHERLINSMINKSTAGTSPVLVTHSRTDRVSGLRIPSPKIGFFEDNPTSLAPNGCTPPKGVGNNASTNGAANKSRCSKRSSTRTSSGIPSKTGVKDETRACPRGKPLKRREYAHDEANKENVANLENQVKDLSRSMKAIDFGEDLFRELKGNQS